MRQYRSHQETSSFAPEPPITPEKLLSKICFARFGGSVDLHREEFYRDLLDHLSKLNSKPITRQTILFWLNQKKNSVPSRVGALAFLRSYVTREINLSEEAETYQYNNHDFENRKKVRSQLVRYLEKILDADNANSVTRELVDGLDQTENISIFMNSSRRIVIDLGKSDASHDRYFTESVIGVFDLYRHRFSPSGSNFIAKEMIHVFRKGSETRFRHWYLHEGEEISRFDGVVIAIGESLWFISCNHRESNRLRVMKFRYLRSPSKKYREVKWGIMLTDTPFSSSFDPVSCRVLLVRNSKFTVINDTLIRETVRNISGDDLPCKTRGTFLRLIDNNITASSFPENVEPVVSSSGAIVKDVVLRVNQETLEKAANLIIESMLVPLRA